MLFFPCVQAFAHAGHDHTPGDSEDAVGNGPVQISAEAKQNLGITTAEAEVRTIEKTLSALGTIQSVPGRLGVVSSQVPGRIYTLSVAEGQRVKKGDPIATVETSQSGGQSPRVTYSSPIDGVVTARHIILGSSVEVNTPLVEIADLTRIYAEAKVFEGQVTLIKPGQDARVQVESYPGQTFEGVVDLVDSQLDPASRTLKAWVRLKNDDYKLRPNMQATVSLVIAKGDSVTAIPRTAVLGDMGNLFVFVETGPKGLTYERRPVVTGIADDRFVEAIEGVLPGDKVVTQGNYQLQYVSSKKPAAAPGPAGASTPATAPAQANRMAAFLPWLAGIAAVSVLLNVFLLFSRRGSSGTPATALYRPGPVKHNGDTIVTTRR